MSGIVAAGDRAGTAARRLRPLAAYPPREVPALALWFGSMRVTAALPVALALTLCGLMFAAAAILEPPPRTLPPWLPALFLMVALGCWLLAAARLRRARRLLEGGMPARARITRVHENLLVHSAGRARSTIEYDWSFAGQSGHVRAHGYVGRNDRALLVGQELELVCDPAAPAEQLIPLFYGFRLESF